MLLVPLVIMFWIALQNGYTALMCACAVGATEIVAILLSRIDIDVNHHSNCGYTALMCACSVGHHNVAAILLNHKGVHVNARNREGQTALILASMEGHRDIVSRLLLDGRTDISAIDKVSSYHSGETKIAVFLIWNELP